MNDGSEIPGIPVPPLAIDSRIIDITFKHKDYPRCKINEAFTRASALEETLFTHLL